MTDKQFAGKIQKSKQSLLIYILYIKITLTISLWAIPLLIFPDSFFALLGLPAITPELYRRLLGMAYLALVVGYIEGLISARKGIFPTGIVLMGILSNFGASIILSIYAISGGFSGFSTTAFLLMYFSIFATGLIATLLLKELLVQ